MILWLWKAVNVWDIPQDTYTQRAQVLASDFSQFSFMVVTKKMLHVQLKVYRHRFKTKIWMTATQLISMLANSMWNSFILIWTLQSNCWLRPMHTSWIWQLCKEHEHFIICLYLKNTECVCTDYTYAKMGWNWRLSDGVCRSNKSPHFFISVVQGVVNT